MSTVMKTMELAEILQRLSFLDEERRKDKETIATLMERVEAQTGQLQAQKRQVQELEGLLTSTRADFSRFSQLERAMEQLRQEVALLIEAGEEKQQKSLQEFNRARQVEQDALTRQMADLRQALKTLSQHDEGIQGLQAEIGRLNAGVVGLQHRLAELDKRSDDRTQSVVYLEEQRRHDNRRIAQSEAEITGLRKEVDNLTGKSQLLEQAVQTKNKEIDNAAELLQQQAAMIESQRVSHFRTERQVAEWAKLVEELKQEAASMTTQTARLREQNQLVQRALADLETFRERIERRQDEMAEIQRLAEDRQKRAMEEWQAEREKERQRFKLDNDERWRENARLNEKRHAHLQAVEEFVLNLRSQIKALWNVQEAWAQSVTSSSREWTATLGEIVKQRPAMPESLKPVSPTPSETPKIRPLPSAQPAAEEEGEE